MLIAKRASYYIELKWVLLVAAFVPELWFMGHVCWKWTKSHVCNKLHCTRRLWDDWRGLVQGKMDVILKVTSQELF